MNRSASIRRASLASALSQSPIFSGLPEADLFRIASYAEVRPLPKDEMLFREGEPVAGFFVLRKGLIKAYRTGPSGREQVIHLIHAGESFAEPAVAGLPGYPAHTRALENSEVILICRDPFLEHLRESPDLALRMLASLSRHLHGLVGTIESYKLRDAESRLIHWLQERCGNHGKPVEIRMSTSKIILAEELGTRPETLSRIFAKLRNAGLLSIKGRQIRIPHPARLLQTEITKPSRSTS